MENVTITKVYGTGAEMAEQFPHLKESVEEFRDYIDSNMKQ